MFRLPQVLHVPMFGFTLLAFLLVCAVLAVAAFLLFRSGEQGQTKLGGCAGCAIGFALVVIAGMAAAMACFVMCLDAQSEALRRGPVKSIELQFPEHEGHDGHDGQDAPDADGSDATPPAPGELRPVHPAPKDEKHALHLKLVIRGKEYPAKISEWVRENTEGDVTVSMSTDGDRTIVDLGLPCTRAELQQFKRDLKEALPDMNLPKGIKVEIKDTDD